MSEVLDLIKDSATGLFWNGNGWVAANTVEDFKSLAINMENYLEIMEGVSNNVGEVVLHGVLIEG